MPLCGFNKKMLEGLVAFHEGLVEHGLIERSKVKGQSTAQTLQRELSDMDRFLAETGNLIDSNVRGLVEGITKYAKAFYHLIDREGIDGYKEVVAKLNELYFQMDDKFYRELEGKSDDMKELVSYLNEVNFK